MVMSSTTARTLAVPLRRVRCRRPASSTRPPPMPCACEQFDAQSDESSSALDGTVRKARVSAPASRSAALEAIRQVPEDLADAWKAAGAWRDVTMGTLLEHGLLEHGSTRFRVFSDMRPYDGTVGDVADRARRLAGGLARRGV